MRRFVAALVAALAVLALLVASPASSQREPQVIRVLGIAEAFYPIRGFDEERAPTAGDSFSFEGSFYSWASRKRVGRFQVLITVVTPRWGQLSATGSLPGGTVIVAGRTPLFEVPLERYAITGGTGRYAGARGTLTVRILPGASDKNAMVFRLLP